MGTAGLTNLRLCGDRRVRDAVLALAGWLLSRFAGWLYQMQLRELRHREMRRGFEVKQTTGETPVLREERENDHG